MNEPRDVTPEHSMEVTKFTDLSEGVFWTLNEEANEVVLYDAITNRQLVNVIGAMKNFRNDPEFGLIMSVVLEFSSNIGDPDASRFFFAGDILHLEYVEQEEEEECSSGGGSQGDEEDDSGSEEEKETEAEESEEEEETEAEEIEGESEGESEGEGQRGAGAQPNKVTEEEEEVSGSETASGGGGIDGSYGAEGKVKIGRRRLGWEKG